jgi:hypothetical protein
VPTRLASFASVASLCVAAFLVSGCSTPAEPAGPEPVFSSDAEAFAAAEATYRAYVDALNDVDLSDPATFEPVFALTTGELNASDRTSFSTWHAEGFTISGAATVTALSHTDASPSSGAVTLDVCYDVSGVDVLDSEGQSVVLQDRPSVQRLEVELVKATRDAEMLVTTIGASLDKPAC